jgi:hypothetical protein
MSEATPECVKVLARADCMALTLVGFASRELPQLRAYREALALGASVRVDLERVLNREGTPAGRAYAALLLTQLDPSEAEVRWNELIRSEDEVLVRPGGCAGAVLVPLRILAREFRAERDPMVALGRAYDAGLVERTRAQNT